MSNNEPGKSVTPSNFAKWVKTPLGVVAQAAGLLATLIAIYQFYSPDKSPAPTSSPLKASAPVEKQLDKSYEMLSNPDIASNLVGKSVTVQITYLGIADKLNYCFGVLKVFDKPALLGDRLCVNHRDAHYREAASAFGASSNIELPRFAMSFDKALFDTLSSFKTNQILQVQGVVQMVDPSLASLGKSVHFVASAISPAIP